MKKILYALTFLLFLSLTARDSYAVPKGYLLEIDGAISPITFHQVRNIIRIAGEEKADFIIITLNTPGGLLSSTRRVVQEILASEIPVIAYVYPKGSQCASAGTFVALSCHVIAMSPATNIGAAHPVTMMGQPDDKIEEKIVNDTVSFVKSIAEHRKKNIGWAEKAVRESLSSTETEALEEGAIDIIASSMDELLEKLNGRDIDINGETTTLNTAGALLLSPGESLRESILKVIADPNIAYILLMIGVLGITLQLYNPGLGLPGVVGTISLILAFFALHTLPINIAGVILIVLAFIFFAIEFITPAFGLFIISGVISLLLGSFFIFRPAAELQVSGMLITISVTLVGLILWAAIWFTLKTRNRIVVTGSEGLIGSMGRTVSTLSPEGMVLVQGENWQAMSASGTVGKGEKIIVKKVDGLTLIVEPVVKNSEEAQ